MMEHENWPMIRNACRKRLKGHALVRDWAADDWDDGLQDALTWVVYFVQTEELPIPICILKACDRVRNGRTVQYAGRDNQERWMEADCRCSHWYYQHSLPGSVVGCGMATERRYWQGSASPDNTRESIEPTSTITGVPADCPAMRTEQHEQRFRVYSDCRIGERSEPLEPWDMFVRTLGQLVGTDW